MHKIYESKAYPGNLSPRIFKAGGAATAETYKIPNPMTTSSQWYNFQYSTLLTVLVIASYKQSTWCNLSNSRCCSQSPLASCTISCMLLGLIYGFIRWGVTIYYTIKSLAFLDIRGLCLRRYILIDIDLQVRMAVTEREKKERKKYWHLLRGQNGL